MPSSSRVYRPPLGGALRLATFFVLILFASNACKSPAHHSLRTEITEGIKVSNLEYRKIVETGLSYWSQKDLNSAYAYTLDPLNSRMGVVVPAALQHVLTPRPDVLPENQFIIYIDEVVRSEDGLAFLTMRTTNRFEATEYAIVFEPVETAWRVRDYFLIAEGLLNTALINFSWEVYQSGRLESRHSD